MSTNIETPAIPDDVLAEIRQRAARAYRGIRDADDVRKACERMGRMREELKERLGEIDLAVELIREARDQG
jgi:hypothetical protein